MTDLGASSRQNGVTPAGSNLVAEVNIYRFEAIGVGMVVLHAFFI